MGGIPATGTETGRRRRRLPVFLCALLAAALSACVGERREVQIGDELATHLNARIPLVEDTALNRYVGSLGQMLASVSERPDLTYHFYIVDSDEVNAFALPGGHIYLDRGLIERTHNVSELSAVLAHEIGHVAARHGAKSLQRQMRTGSLVGILYRTILGREPKILDQEALKLGGAVWSAAHSRADEQEADRLAVDYLIRTGVDPRGMLTFLHGLLAEERAKPGPGGQPEWLSTHPATDARIVKAKEEIDTSLTSPPPPLARDVPSYRGFLRRMEELPPPPPPLPLR